MSDFQSMVLFVDTRVSVKCACNHFNVADFRDLNWVVRSHSPERRSVMEARDRFVDLISGCCYGCNRRLLDTETVNAIVVVLDMFPDDTLYAALYQLFDIHVEVTR